MSDTLDSGGDHAAKIDATLTSRYECKYLIDALTADGLRSYLSSHAELDPYSRKSGNGSYRVLSLYLDSLGLRLYRDTAQGVRNRFKLRLRYYAEEGDGPVFFEVKKRSDVIVRKSRQAVSREQAEDFLRNGTCALSDERGDMCEFLDTVRAADAWPALRLRYWREAWESQGIDPIRITFDTEVEHCALSNRGLVETRPDWTRTPIRAPVILELKFTDHRPRWVDELLQRFQLDKVSVAKYAESIEHVLDSGERRSLEAQMLLARSRRNGSRSA